MKLVVFLYLLTDTLPFFVKDKDAEKQYKFSLQRFVSEGFYFRFIASTVN